MCSAQLHKQMIGMPALVQLKGKHHAKPWGTLPAVHLPQPLPAFFCFRGMCVLNGAQVLHPVLPCSQLPAVMLAHAPVMHACKIGDLHNVHTYSVGSVLKRENVQHVYPLMNTQSGNSCLASSIERLTLSSCQKLMSCVSLLSSRIWSLQRHGQITKTQEAYQHQKVNSHKPGA